MGDAVEVCCDEFSDEGRRVRKNAYVLCESEAKTDPSGTLLEVRGDQISTWCSFPLMETATQDLVLFQAARLGTSVNFTTEYVDEFLKVPSLLSQRVPTRKLYFRLPHFLLHTDDPRPRRYVFSSQSHPDRPSNLDIIFPVDFRADQSQPRCDAGLFVGITLPLSLPSATD